MSRRESGGRACPSPVRAELSITKLDSGCSTTQVCVIAYVSGSIFADHAFFVALYHGTNLAKHLSHICNPLVMVLIQKRSESEPGLNCQECSTFCFTGHYVPPPRYFWWLIFVTAAMSTPSNLALCASPPSSFTQTPSHLTSQCPTKTLEPGDFCPSSTNIDSSGKRRLYPYLSYLC